MATSGVTSSSSSAMTATIDVAGMVAGLMAIEKKPLIALQSQITNQTTKISDLGRLQSKAATFQAALQDLENPSSFASAVGSSSNTSIVAVTSSTGAIAGSHDISVTQLAKPAQYIFDGFADSDTTPLGSSNATFTITVGTSPDTTAHPITVNSTTTLLDLSNSINALGINVAASVTPTADGKYALTIQGTQSGAINNFTVDGDNIANLITPTASNSAQDAEFMLDGVQRKRATNNINDVLKGTTINLVSNGTATITLANGVDNGPSVIKNLIMAFNDLVSTAKILTQKASSDGATPAGQLAGSPGYLAFIDQMKSMLAMGATYKNGATPLGLVQLGIDIQQDGTLRFNSAEYASTSNIASILASGINVGSTDFDTRTNNLNAYINAEVEYSGLLDQSIANEKKSLKQMSQKQQSLQMQLDSKEARYTNQYSSLNALLFTLNQTSNSLTSALAGLTAGQNNN